MSKKEEIDVIISMKEKWNLRYPDKKDARDMIMNLRYFMRDFDSNFNEIKLNMTSKHDFEDAIEDLKYYEESKLKKKDDTYFRKGINYIQEGLQSIIDMS